MILAMLYLSFAMVCGRTAWVRWHGDTRNGTCPSTTTAWDLALQAALTPASNQSIGQYTCGGFTPVSHFAPSDLLAHSGWMEGSLEFVGFLVMILAIIPVGFALLPHSRRVAKVKSSHIVRVALYGSICLVPGLLMKVFAPVFNDGDVFLFLLNWSGVVLLAIIPFQFIWWSVATSYYLKMRHAWGIAAALVVIAFCTALLVLLFPPLIQSD
jgi:hypothetical protein